MFFLLARGLGRVAVGSQYALMLANSIVFTMNSVSRLANTVVFITSSASRLANIIVFTMNLYRGLRIYTIVSNDV